MSYLVLARKYRPRTFADMVGQETVTRTLRGAIGEQRIGHAYLFCGPRGTGKTTTARIFAKCLNCEQGPTAEPCGTCERCRSADDGSEIDIIEIDAASNRRIEDFRTLRDQVGYAPMRARFKVYIIDEVHMLTKEAFNAFLKTLEEPPAHVKFLFATTDPEKVLETIRSRCQILKLSPLNEATIAARLTSVFEREQIHAGSGVAEALAKRARGGMRDALSLADQLLSLSGDAPSLEDVGRLSEVGDGELVESVFAAVEAHDKRALIEALPTHDGGEGELADLLLDHVRAALLCALCGKDTPLVADGGAARERLVARAARLGVERLEIWLDALLAARERMQRTSAHARVALELSLLDLCRTEASLDVTRLVERLEALEARLGSGAPTTQSAARPANPSTTNAAPSATLRPDVPPLSARDTLQPAPRPAAPAPVRAPLTFPAASPVASLAANATASPAARPGAAPVVAAAPRPAPKPAPLHEPVSAADRARPMVAGVADAWSRFVAALAKQSPALADALRLRGKLADLTGGRAVVKLANLRDHERALVLDAHNQALAASAFGGVLGTPVNLVFEDQAAVKSHKDGFTGKVAELFDGRVEED